LHPKARLTRSRQIAHRGKKAVESEQFRAVANIGDVVAYLDQPDFAKFWDADAKRVEAAVGRLACVTRLREPRGSVRLSQRSCGGRRFVAEGLHSR
jgi:hypothetical protein